MDQVHQPQLEVFGKNTDSWAPLQIELVSEGWAQKKKKKKVYVLNKIF